MDDPQKEILDLVINVLNKLISFYLDTHTQPLIASLTGAKAEIVWKYLYTLFTPPTHLQFHSLIKKKVAVFTSLFYRFIFLTPKISGVDFPLVCLRPWVECTDFYLLLFSGCTLIASVSIFRLTLVSCDTILLAFFSFFFSFFNTWAFRTATFLLILDIFETKVFKKNKIKKLWMVTRLPLIFFVLIGVF